MPISADGPEGTEALCEGMPGKLYKDCRGVNRTCGPLHSSHRAV